MKLTQEQLRVVRHGKGNLFVKAGPGCGKTETLIRRIDYLVNTIGVLAEEILVLTLKWTPLTRQFFT